MFDVIEIIVFCDKSQLFITENRKFENRLFFCYNYEGNNDYFATWYVLRLCISQILILRVWQISRYAFYASSRYMKNYQTFTIPNDHYYFCVTPQSVLLLLFFWEKIRKFEFSL